MKVLKTSWTKNDKMMPTTNVVRALETEDRNTTEKKGTTKTGILEDELTAADLEADLSIVLEAQSKAQA